MASLAALWKFSQFIFWCAVLVPIQALVMLFSKKDAFYILPSFWHRRVIKIFNISVEVQGSPCTKRPCLYVSNHVSYLDIPVIASVMPVSFVAKEDVASWPLFGLLAKLQRTAFISRKRSSAILGQNNLLTRLQNDGRIVIFPEGTSSNGFKVLSFKSTLFNVATDQSLAEKLYIQPFTIELLQTNGTAINNDEDRDLYAWHGDMELMPHFWAFAKCKGAKVKLHFHAPIRVQHDEQRKALAIKCFEIVAQPLNKEQEKAA